VPHEKVPLLIRASEIFVLNSEYEGLSHTLIEVQTLGTPIVASRVCGNPEVVVDGESGLLVDPRDATQLVRAISKLLEDSAARDRFVRRGVDLAQRFLRDTTFQKVLAALERAAASVRP